MRWQIKQRWCRKLNYQGVTPAPTEASMQIKFRMLPVAVCTILLSKGRYSRSKPNLKWDRLCFRTNFQRYKITKGAATNLNLKAQSWRALASTTLKRRICSMNLAISTLRCLTASKSDTKIWRTRSSSKKWNNLRLKSSSSRTNSKTPKARALVKWNAIFRNQRSHQH